jgi:osmotically-inducible protein OsmY
VKTDIQLHKAVIDALSADQSLDATSVAIVVKEGVAGLSGTVRSHAEKVRIEEIVRHVHGIRGIAEDILVNPPEHHRRTDLEIAEAALNILRWDIMVPADDIQVKVEHGWITLTGEVQWFFQREAAEHALQNLTYIKGISNKVSVIPEHRPKDLKHAVEAMLARDANPALHHLSVSVHEQAVTLTGKVGRWRDREDAGRAVWNVAGVREVINIIDVAPVVAV